MYMCICNFWGTPKPEGCTIWRPHFPILRRKQEVPFGELGHWVTVTSQINEHNRSVKMPTESIWNMDRDQRTVVWFSTALVKITGMNIHTGHQRRNQYVFRRHSRTKWLHVVLQIKWLILKFAGMVLRILYQIRCRNNKILVFCSWVIQCCSPTCVQLQYTKLFAFTNLYRSFKICSKAMPWTFVP